MRDFHIAKGRKSIFSLNQDQGSVFTIRECAQSIPRLEKPKSRLLSHKNSKMFDFRFNTPIPSMNQSQGNVFTLRECAQSIFHMILPLQKSGLYTVSHKTPGTFSCFLG